MSEATNPFEPPKADWDRAVEPVEPVEESADYFVRASQGARLTNLFVDSLVMTVLIALIGDDWSFVIVVSYYVLFEWLFGKTPGKWISKTRVITKTGRRPRFLQILGRTLTRYICIDAFTFLGRKGSGWHDTWSGTLVVRDGVERGRRRKRRRRR